jgi:hypothetical protein
MRVELLAAIGGLAFVAASLVIGARLLLLARRTGELPELLIGSTLFLMGGIAYPMLSVARLAVGLSEPLRIGLGVSALVLNGVGAVCVAVFNWRVFRPGERWARGAVWATAAVLAASFLLQGLSGGLTEAALWNRGLGLRLYMFFLGPPLAWASYESIRFHGLLARRTRLGLADPIVTDRMWLWGVSTLCAFILNMATSIGALFFGIDFAATVFGALMIAPLGLVAACGMWLAFLPPASYTRRVSARAAMSEA